MRSRPIVNITLVIAIVVLALSGLVAYRANVTLADASDRLVRAKDLELSLERTLSLMRDAETGQRGFLLTRRRLEYLGPYERALAELESQLMQLRALLADDAAVQPSFEELAALVRVKTDELARTVDLERSGQTEEARGVVLTDAGRIAMDEIRAAVERLEADAERDLAARLATASKARSAVTRSIVAALELGGHRVQVAHDGAEALETLSRSRFDLALLDIGMPNLSGYDVAKRVRESDRTITLVAVTGWGKDSDRERALAAGFNHHWVKPIEPTKALELCATAAATRTY